MPAELTRTLKKGMVGKDVQAVRRACLRFLGRTLPTATLEVQRTFGASMQQLVKDAQDEAVILQSGVVGPNLMSALRRADHPPGNVFDAYSVQLLEQYADEQKPKLVEPLQGFSSLHPSLWKAYSKGRQAPYNLSDLGTYNPASNLPSGAPSDHAVYPAFAFDLGISPDTGWNNVKARTYVLQVAGWREIEYVILGDRIYTGHMRWHRYTGGGHLNHVHVSGNR